MVNQSRLIELSEWPLAKGLNEWMSECMHLKKHRYPSLNRGKEAKPRWQSECECSPWLHQLQRHIKRPENEEEDHKDVTCRRNLPPFLHYLGRGKRVGEQDLWRKKVEKVWKVQAGMAMTLISILTYKLFVCVFHVCEEEDVGMWKLAVAYIGLYSY